MKRILFSAMSSSSGKTVAVCTFLRALQRRNLKPVAMKCGPDYIDPMFHRRVLGVPTGNVDLFLQGREGALSTVSRKKDGDILVFEGAMGYYDGRGGTSDCSAWETAVLTRTPAVLVVRPSGSSITLAAQIKGLQSFRSPSKIAGILLNDCKDSLYAHLRPILEKETGLPVVGYLPHREEATLESRHLGLKTAGEIADFSARFDALAEALEEHCDIDALLRLASDEPLVLPKRESEEICPCTIAVARDEAFCFYYEENLEALRSSGARLVEFSPLRDAAVPQADALYLGGGYPELYAQTLSRNTAMLRSIRSCIQSGMPTIAECGGFMALHEKIGSYPMVGILPGEAFETKRLQRFGYTTLRAKGDSLLFRAGEETPCHEFHYWDCTENGTDLTAFKKPGNEYDCGFCTENLYAAYPHLHFGGKLPLARRFCAAAENYHRTLGENT